MFGAENFCAVITFTKTTGQTRTLLPVVADYLLWYAKDRERAKFRQLYERKALGGEGATEYFNVELPGGESRKLTDEELANPGLLPKGAKIFATDSIVSDGFSGENSADIELEHGGRKFVLSCGPKRHWKVGVEGVKKLWAMGRLMRREGLRIYKRYFEDFPFVPFTSVWADTRGETDMDYVVQTSRKVIERCLLMTTDPGDLVLDPTCGSGTTAYVAEQWGRRWITIDTSRVPLALVRQRLLTATFPYYEVHSGSAGVSPAVSGVSPETSASASSAGTPKTATGTVALPNNPANGFVYRRRQNARGEEIGGIVPHITLKSVANNEPPEEEVLVDSPEVVKGVVRVTGPFGVEATIPTPVDFEADGVEDSRAKTPEEFQSHLERMLEALRRSPVLHLPGNQTVTFRNVRQPAKSLSLHAEAEVVAQVSHLLYRRLPSRLGVRTARRVWKPAIQQTRKSALRAWPPSSSARKTAR